MAQSSAKSANNAAAPAASAKSSRRVAPMPAPQKVRAVTEPAARTGAQSAALVTASAAGAPGSPEALGDAATIPRTSTSFAVDASQPSVAAERAVRRLNGGAPLPPSTRERMEASFGRSFESVRVHTDAAGAELAQGVGAEAVTVGDAIAFTPAAFRPETTAGEHLIAHELAHVVQGGAPERGGAFAPAAFAPAAHFPHSQPSEPAELAAEQAANAVSRGEPARVSPGTLGGGLGASPGGGSGSSLGAAIGGVSTRSRLMRRARAGGLPVLVASTPTPGTGAIGTDEKGLDEEEQKRAEAEASGEQSGVFKRQQASPPEAPAGANGAGAAGGAAGGAAPGGAAAAAGAADNAAANATLRDARRKRADEEQRKRDPLGQGQSALGAANQKQADQEKKRDEQSVDERKKAAEQQAKNQRPAPPPPGSPEATQAAAVTEEAAAAAPTPPPEAVAADAAQDEAEVAESESEAQAAQAATEATPEDPEAAKQKEKAPASPEEDTAFVAVVGQARAATFQQGHNTAAERKVAEMQQAVTDPPGTADAKAKGAHVAGPMASSEPAPFDRGKFEQAVLKAIAGVEPASAEQAKGFRVPGSVGAAVSAATAGAKSEAAGPVAGAASATPSTAGVTTDAGGAVPPMPAGPAAVVPAEGAAPKPRGEGQVEDPLLAPGKDFDKKLEESGFEEKTFANSNEPELTGVLTERDSAHEQTDAIIEENRKAEELRIDESKAGATNTADAGTAAMNDTRGAQFASIVEGQKGGKSKEEQARAEINQKLDEIYGRSKQKVDDKLEEVDRQVDTEFNRGLQAAISAYQTYTDGETGSTFNKIFNFFDWTEFKNRVYGEGKRRWQNVMRQTISTISGIVANGLNQAHQFAVDGAAEAKTFFEKLPAEKQKLGQEAFADIQGKFDGLKSTVEAHGQKLVTELADKYKKASEELDKRIEADKEKNKNLWEQAGELLTEGLALLEKLKEMLLGVASSAASVIGQILADPGAFLNTLIDGIKGGLGAFVANIGAHLQKGLMTWLLGQLPPGITLPEEFDLKGIITLGLQILGLTYANFRARAVAIVGEPIVKALETAAEVFLIFLREGPAGLWRFIKDQVSDLKDMVLGAIRDMVITEVVKAGISFVLGLLNPAGALIKIIKMIIDIVTFFVTRGSQIVQLVQAVIGSLAAIAGGNSGALAKAVENALASAIPVVLGFLAALAGLGGIPQKIQGILDRIRAPINKAIDFVINLAVKVVKAAGKLIGGAFGKPKTGDDPTAEDDPQKQAKIDAGLAAIDQEEQKFLEGGKIGRDEAEKVAATVKAKHPVFKSLTVVDGGDSWDYDYQASPGKKKEGEKKDEGEPFPKVDVFFNPHHDWANQFLDKAKTVNVRKDYLRQLAQQQAGIRDIKSGEWVGRRLAFIFRGGRDPASAAHQAELRDMLRTQMFARLMNEGVKPSAATRAVDKFLSGRHVLHDPDQVAAGQAFIFNRLSVAAWQQKFEDAEDEPTEQARQDKQAAAERELENAFGLARVNSSIGAQWVTKDRASEYGAEADADGASKVNKIDNAVIAYLGEAPEDKDRRDIKLAGVTLHPTENE